VGKHATTAVVTYGQGHLRSFLVRNGLARPGTPRPLTDEYAMDRVNVAWLHIEFGHQYRKNHAKRSNRQTC
jgi:hypothetical protein